MRTSNRPVNICMSLDVLWKAYNVLPARHCYVFDESRHCMYCGWRCLTGYTETWTQWTASTLLLEHRLHDVSQRLSWCYRINESTLLYFGNALYLYSLAFSVIFNLLVTATSKTNYTIQATQVVPVCFYSDQQWLSFISGNSDFRLDGLYGRYGSWATFLQYPSNLNLWGYKWNPTSGHSWRVAAGLPQVTIKPLP